jgi:type I restriction enzyme, S subunit
VITVQTPAAWGSATLGEVAPLARTTVTPDRILQGAFYVGLEHVDGDGTIAGVEVDTGEISSNKFTFTKNDILYGKLRPYLRKIALPDRDGVCTTEIVPIRPSKRVHRSFLYHYLRQPRLVKFATERCTGANLPRLSPKLLAQFPVPLPPLDEQRRIAAILDKADAIRRKRREAIALTEELLRSTFLEMFGDPVTNPKGWPVLSVEQLLADGLQNGAYFPKDRYTGDGSGVEMVHMKDAFHGVVERGGLRRVDASTTDQKKYALHADDVLIARRSLNVGGSAKPCLIPPSDRPLIFESSLIRVRLDQSRALPLYFFHYFANERARSKYVFPHVTTSTISGINQPGLRRVQVLAPPTTLQRDFSDFVKQQNVLVNNLRAATSNSNDLFHGLVQRAFRGEL